VQTVSAIAQARALFTVLPRPLGFVPTMGALHDGHLALVRRARAECSSVVASIFVNPMQFAPTEDLARYPRDLEGDCAKLARCGVDAVFIPTVEAIYPPDFTTTVDVGTLGTVYEGAARPAHFRGVTTVMTKLLNIVSPDKLYMGQKDAQQAAVLRKMIRDLEMNIAMAIVPTERDRDGLAMSSRNLYLSNEERAAAPSLHQALGALRLALSSGRSKDEAVAAARAALSPIAQPDYFDVVDGDTFEPIDSVRGPAFVIGAARFGNTRLIDNLWIER
jgi:pantoate--beta-alanine ligase